MPMSLSIERIITAAILAAAVYALTAPFRRFVDEKLERKSQ